MRYYVPLAAPEVPRNAMLDFSPINNAFDGMREQNNRNEQMAMRREEQNYQRGRDAKQDARSEVEWYGKTAAAIDRLEGPQRQAAWQRIVARHGADGLTPEEMDPITGPKLMMAQAGQWRDPREDQLADLKVQQAQNELAMAPLDRQYKEAQIGHLNAQAANVGRTPNEPRAATRGAPSGYMWNDTNDPSRGVSRLPGYEQTVPGEVAGKVAMMNMARQRIEATRQVFERDWGAGDVGQWAAGNVPLVGDIAPMSGDIGIAQRDIQTGIEAALRTMTGAAAPEGEVVRYMRMFMPGPKDTKKSATQKINGLLKFMDDAGRLVMQGRGDAQFEPETAIETPSEASNTQPQRIIDKAQYDALPPGTQYVAPDGQVRTKR